MMSIHYRYPILLIEFDKSYGYSLQVRVCSQFFDETRLPRQSRWNDLDVQSRLVLLTLSFPRLCIIWSSSSYSTADIFSDLKQDFDEPDPVTSAAIGHVQGEINSTYNYTPVDMLRTMPGVTSKNFTYICNNVRNVQELCHMSSESIQQLIGSELGKKLYEFLHQR